ncbi:hypothetical protein GQ43DRAFT_410520 [Delitschia confertaspora ATCC 74209]|uniref:Jacalin-type lectin domain-containing protein n=1 Tax=Delitschia confertaspora ATCC 74209 TaxID=1513339 RepID=A0A9P4JQM4_9PLEO|nr:hypothetical protein GQ43DRAFT_410520 [Delitschia confertaspora ATCC 74209]
MKFFDIIVGTVTLFSATAAAVRIGDCAGDGGGIWQNQEKIKAIGAADDYKDHGDPFCETKYKQGVVINEIEVWANSEVVRGIRFGYSDGTSSSTHGKAEGDRNQKIQWDSAHDKVEKITVWGNGIGTRVGKIQIETLSGKKLEVGRDIKKQTPYELEVGGGIILASYGAQGFDINKIGFLVIAEPVQHVTISDVVFADDIKAQYAKKQGIESKVLYSTTFENNQKLNQTFSFWNTITKTIERSVTETLTTAWGTTVTMELSAEFMGIGPSFGLQERFDITYAQAEEEKTAKTTTLTWHHDGTVPVGGIVGCVAYTESGSMDSDYTSTVTVDIGLNGKKFQFKENGHLKSMGWAQAQSVCGEGKSAADLEKEILKQNKGRRDVDEDGGIDAVRRVARGMLGA